MGHFAFLGVEPVLGLSRGREKTAWLRRKEVRTGEAGPPHMLMAGLGREEVPYP